MNKKFPVPVTFNTHKHHFKFLLDRIEIWKNLDWKLVEAEIAVIGENLIDFYTGELTVQNICNECNQHLKNKNVNDKVAFLSWLNPLKYKKLKLSDSSEWILREGKNADRYIHIHPAKKSLHTIRVRATTLKTVIAIIVKSCNISNQMYKNLQTVNKLRTENLHLSPVKSLQKGKGILRLWELFSTKYF